MLKTNFLILSLILFGCAERPFPIEYVYVIDTTHNVCAKKKIINQDDLIFEHVEDMPLANCNGYISIDKNDFHPLKDWIRWAKGKLEECRSKLSRYLNNA